MASARSLCMIVLGLLLAIGIFIVLLIFPLINDLQAGMHTGVENDHSDPEHLHWGYGVLKSIKGIMHAFLDVMSATLGDREGEFDFEYFRLDSSTWPSELYMYESGLWENFRRQELLPEHWAKKYKECAGSHQSPINFETHLIRNNSLLSALNYLNYDERAKDDMWTATNNGHTVQFTADFESRPAVNGGGLQNGTYYFRQFHYHWGSNDESGSEHLIDGRRFPIELHLVHIRNESDSSPYKIAVVGVFAAVKNDNDPEEAKKILEMRQIMEAARLVRETGSTKTVHVPGFTLSRFIPPKPQFFRYYGSLTTPPCTENVQWTVMEYPIPISKSQLEIFRQLVAHSSRRPQDHLAPDEYMQNNYRPVQSSQGRTINYFPGTAPPPSRSRRSRQYLR